MPLEAGPLEILDGVGLVVRRVALGELLGQRVAELGDAAVRVPECLEAVEKIVPGLGKVAAVRIILADLRGAGGGLVAPLHHVPDAAILLPDAPQPEPRDARLPDERELRVECGGALEPYLMLIAVVVRYTGPLRLRRLGRWCASRRAACRRSNACPNVTALATPPPVTFQS